ncbi:MAG: phosphatase PAP2 family protein [Bacteroidota bacterium]|nr:phosphatase PAP2 family protein [Bacteroidota bacterium]
MSLFKYLKRLDKILFIFIHNDSQHQVLDGMMLAIRNPVTWIPLYIFMVFFVIKKTGSKAWLFIVLSLLTVAMTDISTGIILKPLFGRLRPCFDREMRIHIRHIINCGGMYSFPSSHAANHFGMAAFWFWSLFKITGKKWKWLWVWASLICYAQVYVGKHFPADVVMNSFIQMNVC